MGLLHDPVFNKGTAHPLIERERLGLRGLLPPRTLTMEQQLERTMERFLHGDDWLTVEDQEAGDVTPEHLRKWHLLQELQDRNETLFYRVLRDHFVEMAPVVYTPVVGHVCRNYHKLYRRPRGMYFSAADRGEMATMTWNWPADDIDAIVVTDGSRILGLGDLGANGLGIAIGKLDLYVAAGGFNPGRVLPCVVDVGTDNEALRNDPWYMGLRQPRLTGNDYYAVMDEFVEAVMGRWPDAVLQFEDFNIHHAAPLLERYRHSHTCFNDDIQGTAATAVAGILGALAVIGLPPTALIDQKIVVVGAGSAGMGVVRMIASAMTKYGLSPEAAADRFYVLDARGLITNSRQGLGSAGCSIDPTVLPFARKDSSINEGAKLEQVIAAAKPTVLIGLAGAGRLFSHEALVMMGEINHRPIIFPMSNPTSRMECTHEQAQAATGGRAIFACGSPQPDVMVETDDETNTKVTRVASQANNMYIFPGLAFGAHLAASGIVSDHMIMAAAEALPALLTSEDLEAGRVYPTMKRIREISRRVAVEVIKAAADEGRIANHGAIRALSRGGDALLRYVKGHMYFPEYRSLVAPGAVAPSQPWSWRP